MQQINLGINKYINHKVKSLVELDSSSEEESPEEAKVKTELVGVRRYQQRYEDKYTSLPDLEY